MVRQLVDESWNFLEYDECNSHYKIHLGQAGVNACMTKIRLNGMVSLGDCW